jgi:putative FmdB family regulatory protein
MPIYDFRCDSCEHVFEERTEPGERPPCPACGAPEARRLFAPIPPPPKVGLRGAAARKSDATRKAREERRQEGFAKQREQRKQD